MQCLTQLGNAHVLVFLKLFPVAANHLNPHVDLPLDALCHVRFTHFDTVNCRLMQKQLLHGDLFRYGAIGITLPLNALKLGLQACVLYV